MLCSRCIEREGKRKAPKPSHVNAMEGGWVVSSSKPLNSDDFILGIAIVIRNTEIHNELDIDEKNINFCTPAGTCIKD